eukprot:1010093-Prymnesium_polylepis.1
MKRCDSSVRNRSLALQLGSTDTILSLCGLRSSRRAEDGAIMALIELALVLVYMAVLLMKSCFMSASVCVTYGFGESPKGDSRGLTWTIAPCESKQNSSASILLALSSTPR